MYSGFSSKKSLGEHLKTLANFLGCKVLYFSFTEQHPRHVGVYNVKSEKELNTDEYVDLDHFADLFDPSRFSSV